MKFQMEIDLDAVEGNYEHVAYLLTQIAETLSAGAWGLDLREPAADKLPRVCEVGNEQSRVMARAGVRDEAFDTATAIVRPAAMAPLNDPLNTTPIPESTLQ